MIEIFSDIQLVGTIFAALFGLAFGSFLNVFLTRFPEGENIATPRSHCRNCDHTLTWWENLPLLSWLILRGRCRSCRTQISFRYPLIELAVGLLWTACWLKFSPSIFSSAFPSATAASQLPEPLAHSVIKLIGSALLCWLLVALAALDAEYFWLPDLLTLPGTALGFFFTLQQSWSSSGQSWSASTFDRPSNLLHSAWTSLLAILAAAGLILFIRLAYWLVRRQEGIGLGDAKLMAMLGAWLGLTGALESFALAILGATAASLVWLIILAIRRRSTSEWARMPLPLGTFLCLAALPNIFYPDWLGLSGNGLF